MIQNKFYLIMFFLISIVSLTMATNKTTTQYSFILYNPDTESARRNSSIADFDTSCVKFIQSGSDWYVLIFNSTGDTITHFDVRGNVQIGDTLWAGRGNDSTIYLYANNGDADLPGLRYFKTDNKWQFSNDGSTWSDIGVGDPAPGSDPDISTPGQIGRDTNNHSLRGYDGTNQYIYGQKLKFIKFVVENPDQLTTGTARATKSFSLSPNKSGFSFIITAIDAYSDSDNYAFNLFESYSETDISEANDTLIDLVTCSINGTGTYYANETTITHATIENGHHIIFEHSSGTTTRVTVIISGYYDGDVN